MTVMFKLKWFLSGLILKLFCKKIGFPSYFSFPIFFKGLNKVSLGKKVRIFPGSRIETHGRGTINIGDNVGIAQNFHITSGGKLEIGSGTTIAANVIITNIDHDYKDINKTLLDQGCKITDTEIGSNCFIGAGVIIQAGTKLGNHCTVGANSVVKGNFPDFCVVVGSPAKIVKIYDLDINEWVSVSR